ncbi:MAG: hypothetical protein R3B13_20830 [Polyangiaceae bacterium]
MARSKSQLPKNRRGSPEAIAKRRAGRAFNDVLAGGSRKDGRSENRRKRLLEELEAGTTARGRALKPLELVSHAHELLELGEDPKQLRKLTKKRMSADPDPEVLAAVVELHRAYGFRVDAYGVVGIEPEAAAAAIAQADDEAARAAKRRRRG